MKLRFPQADSLTEPYWASASRGELSFPRCVACDQHHFYPRPACPNCGGEELMWDPVSGHGTIYSYSVVHRAPGPDFADDVPYVIAIVKSAEGPHLLTRIIDIEPERVRVGMDVSVHFVQLPDNMQLPVFSSAGGDT